CLFDAPGAAPWFSDEPLPPLTTAKLDGLLEPRFTLAAAQGQRPGARGSADACLASTRAKPDQPLGALIQPAPEAPLFERDAATLTASAPELIDAIAATLRRFNPATVSAEIVGFGDRPGNAGRKLGQARAERLVEALTAAGVTLDLTATGIAARDAPPSRIHVQLSRAR
ncbi:MAG TPA: hypothetical protein VK034_00625, partial [Enhygromyxa sp.]|nr:hypothetical protein [Enhygromyxa sp.]